MLLSTCRTMRKATPDNGHWKKCYIDGQRDLLYVLLEEYGYHRSSSPTPCPFPVLGFCVSSQISAVGMFSKRTVGRWEAR